MATSLSAGARDRIHAAGTKTPAWKPYVDLLEKVLEEDASGRWNELAIRRADADPAGRPLLLGATITVPAKVARKFVAEMLGAKAARNVDVLAFLSAAANQDGARLVAAATLASLDLEGFPALASLAVSPMLRACARGLAREAASALAKGSCPVCGAWPALGELRGLERHRRLRCGRCAADWAFAWPRCAHCGEADEKRLSHLVLSDDPGGRRVETCSVCRGYVKSVATLSALSPVDLALADLETVDLDLAAQGRGWRLPAAPAFRMDVRVEARA